MIHALGYPYFWICVVLMCGSAITRWVLYLRGSTLHSLWEVWVSTLFLPALVPYYGLLASKAFLVPLVWQLFSVFLVVETVRFFFTAKAREAYRKLGVAKSFLIFGGATLVSLPPLVAVVQYAFLAGPLVTGG
jgi:hypothetical protein